MENANSSFNEPDPAGYEVAFHRSLTTPILVMGVPRTFAMINGTLAAAFFFGLHSIYVLPICIFIHLLAVAATKKDIYFFSVFKKAIRLKKFYRA